MLSHRQLQGFIMRQTEGVSRRLTKDRVFHKLKQQLLEHFKCDGAAFSHHYFLSFIPARLISGRIQKLMPLPSERAGMPTIRRFFAFNVPSLNQKHYVI